jgi:hypothetical protein
LFVVIMIRLKNLYLFLLLLAVAPLSSCDDSLPGAPFIPVPVGPNGMIVYSSIDPNSKDEFVHVIDSNGIEVVTTRKGVSLSEPGDTKLAWTYYAPGGEVELWEGPINGTTSSRISPAMSADEVIIGGSAVMSSNGQKVAFSTANRTNGAVSLYYYKAGNGFAPSPILVTRDFASTTLPSFSPDGNKIAYFYQLQDGSGIEGFAIANVSTESSVLEADLTSRMGPFFIDGSETIDWSPNGKELLFSTGLIKQYLYTEFGDVQSTEYMHGTFSPDGKKIAYVSIVSATFEVQLHVEDRQGGGRTQLTFATDSAALYPCWSPDGAKIIYTSVPINGDDLNGTLKSVSATDPSMTNVIIPSRATRAYWIKREGL